MPKNKMSRKSCRDRGWRAGVHSVIALGAVAVMMFAIPHAVAAFKYLKTGMEVPDFTLKSLEGEKIALSQLKGSPATMLIFWATWSPRSQPALEDAQKLYTQYADKGLKVLAINVNRLNIGYEDKQQISKMKEGLGLSLPIVIDRGLGTYNAFGVVATPSTAILDAEGKIVFEAASYLRFTGENIREQVEVLLGVREAPRAEAVAEKPVFKPARKALLYYNLGRNLLRLGSKEKAISKLENAVEADDKYASPRILLGHLLLGKRTDDSLARAEELFRAAVGLEPENVSALSGLGEVLLELGRTDEAAAEFEKAVALDPAYTPAVANMASVLAKQGKAEEAQEKFKAALELNPLDPGTYYRRGESCEVEGNLKGAASDYRRAIEILMELPLSGDEV